ncbi:MAG: glucose 1-dehydrogenase [Ignavibacteria bacterium]|jgi:3-oxoacyl-[acyl-carrier protein] reductase|nr:glucose 1-dehydrogenase [Ignavibacteria bacterium]
MESSFNLKGKIAIVTGATRGIGWSCAKVLAKNGMTVIINGVSDNNMLNQRVDELKELYGVESEGYLFDVSDSNAVKDCYNNIFKKYKRLDVLVNNAGIMIDALIPMISNEMLDKILDVNIKGAIYNLQYASRLMGRNKSGSIINISSIIGRFGNEGQTVYSASKAALIGITMSAAKELAPQNIRVNAVAPGIIQTDLIKNYAADKTMKLRDSIKMKRIGTPEDISNTVLFLSSSLSEYVTGQVIGVDGGMLI